MNLLTLPFAEVLLSIPNAAGVFAKVNLHTPINLTLPLHVLLQQNQLDVTAILGELFELMPVAKDERQLMEKDNTQIVDYLLTRYHAKHKLQLKELLQLSKRVEMVHCDDALCPHGLSEFLAYMESDLLSHMFKEEQVLFPLIKQSNTFMLSCPINAMRQEHQEHLLSLYKLNQICHFFTMPTDACGTWQELYQLLNEFISDLTQHIVLENNVLFVRAINLTEKAHG